MKKIIFSLTLLLPIFAAAQTTPVSCSGELPPFSDVRRGEITSKIILAKNYYFDSGNNEGTLEERTAKLNEVIKKEFENFTYTRTQEYKSVKCHYRGVDWNRPGNRSWRTIVCQPGFVFVTGSLIRTMNGDWNDGPVWRDNNTSLSWKTGGYRRSETFVEVDAVYADIVKRVRDELDTARKILHDLGIPTQIP